jgi:hypothetical protein
VSSNDNDGNDGSDGVLQVVRMLIGTTSKKMRSELVDISRFFSFWCFMPKGEKLEGSNLFRRHVVATAGGASCHIH